MSEQDRFELYQTLLAAAAEQLGRPVTSEQVKDLACIRMMRETVTLNLIAGRNVDPSALRWLIEELAKFSPPEPPIKVEIEHVEGPVEHCPQCGWSRDYDEPSPTSLSSTPPPDRPDVGFVNFTPPLAPASAPAPVAVHRDPGSIHNAVLNGVPARMVGQSYAAYVGFSGQSVAGPFSVKNEPRPNFESKHSLPNPGGHGGSVCW